MNENTGTEYQCPACAALGAPGHHAPLKADAGSGEQRLICPFGHAWEVHDGIPDLTFPKTLAPSDWQSRASYDSTAGQIYDNAIDWIFATFYANETEIRDLMLDKLNVNDHARVLEVGCGTGRDTKHLQERLPQGELWALDLSPAMVQLARRNCQGIQPNQCRAHFLVGNCSALPFPDRFFDAAYHFGGLNEFADISKALAELSRVVRLGGKVVVGDESMAPWLRQTDYGKVLINNNSLLNHHLPLEHLPANCDEVNVRWLLGNTFYVVDFRVIEGTPPANFDIFHKGKRGGTCRTRYYGKLEGVTPETKALAEEAATRSGTSLHDWLEALIKTRATELLSAERARRD